MAPTSTRCSRTLRRLAVLWIIQTALSLVLGTAHTLLFLRLGGPSPPSHTLLEAVGTLATLSGAAVSILLILGLLSLARERPAAAEATLLRWVAGLEAFDMVSLLLLQLAVPALYSVLHFEAEWLRWLWLPGFVASRAGNACFLLALYRLRRAARSDDEGVLEGAGLALLALLLVMPAVRPLVAAAGASPLLVSLALHVVGAAFGVVIIVLLHRLANALSTAAPDALSPAIAPAGDGKLDAAWGERADGLDLYSSALLWRIGLLVVGAVASFAVARGSERELVKLVLIGFAGAGTLAGIAMFVGLLRLRDLPEESGAGGLVHGTLALMALGLLADLYSLFLLSRLFGNRLSEAYEALDQLPWISFGGQGIGLVGALLLLGAFRRLAVFLGDQDLGDRFARTGALIAVTALVAITLRGLMQSHDVVRAIGPGMVALGLVMLVLAIVALVGFIRLLGELRSVVRSRLTGGGAQP